jgi:uncharacterized SAM-binding protein YcdF (DUF218 family)
MKEYDCIFIPGGGLLPDGSLPAWTIARLQRAIVKQPQTRWIAFLSGGTVHKPPPLDKEGYPIFESRAAAAYLVKNGIAPDQLLTEISSYDTIGNAYFSRLLFSDPGQFQEILVITSEFHLSRTEAAFNWIYGLEPRTLDYQLNYESTPNDGLSDKILSARVSREKKSLKALIPLRKKIKTVSTFQNWFYTEHGAYSVQAQPENISGEILESY